MYDRPMEKLNYCVYHDTVYLNQCLDCKEEHEKELEHLESEEYKKGAHEDFLTDIARDEDLF